MTESTSTIETMKSLVYSQGLDQSVTVVLGKRTYCSPSSSNCHGGGLYYTHDTSKFYLNQASVIELLGDFTHGLSM